MKPLSYHLGIFSADNSIQLSFVVVFLCNTTAKKLPTISQFAFSSQKSETPHCCETWLCVQSKSLEFSSRVCLPLKTALPQHNIPPFNFFNFQLSILNLETIPAQHNIGEGQHLLLEWNQVIVQQVISFFGPQKRYGIGIICTIFTYHMKFLTSQS